MTDNALGKALLVALGVWFGIVLACAIMTMPIGHAPTHHAPRVNICANATSSRNGNVVTITQHAYVC